MEQRRKRDAAVSTTYPSCDVCDRQALLSDLRMEIQCSIGGLMRTWLAAGIAMGVAIGVLIDQLAGGIALGAAIGLVMDKATAKAPPE